MAGTPQQSIRLVAIQSVSIAEVLRPIPQFLAPPPLLKELQKEEADLYRSKDDILQQSQRLTASFLEQKSELEGSARRAEEGVRTAEGKLAALQEELETARYQTHSNVKSDSARDMRSDMTCDLAEETHQLDATLSEFGVVGLVDGVFSACGLYFSAMQSL